MVIDEVQIISGGGTHFKTGEVVPREVVDKANKALGARKRAAEYQAYCHYLSAWQEDKYVIAQANIEVNSKGRIVPELANCRVAGDFQLKRPR